MCFKKAPFPLAPSDEGKRSAVAVVNGCPVDSQSRDRAARRRLSAEQADWGREDLKSSEKSIQYLVCRFEAIDENEGKQYNGLTERLVILSAYTHYAGQKLPQKQY